MSNNIKGFRFNGNTYKYDYNSLENIPNLQTDKTLTATDRPADAKAVGDEIASVRSAVGSPLVAATASAMTDINKVYVYTGSESGYTNGNWYYHNGSAWTSGGVYNAAAVNTDATLSVSGQAADAKKTGDEITDLKGALIKNNSFIIADKGKTSTASGIEFAWSGNTCHVSGTSTGTAFNDLYGSNLSLVYPFEKGKTYRLKMDSASNKVGLQAYCWGATNRSLVTTFANDSFTIPDDAVGIMVRLRVASGLTVDETVHPSVETDVDTNSELTELLKYVFNLNSNYISSIPSGADLNDYTTPGTYKVLSNVISESISNIPYATVGRLIVMTTSALSRIVQFYLANSKINIFLYYRFYDGENWGNWIRFVSENMISPLATDATVNTLRTAYLSGSNELSFSTDGTTINFVLNRVISHYAGARGNLYEKIVNYAEEISVPHDSFAIINYDTSSIEVKTLSQLQSLYDVNYAILFYNSGGNIRGAFEKYAILDLISSQVDVYFYGKNNCPTFVVNNDYSIDVAIPAISRINSLSKQYRSFSYGLTGPSGAQTINVPHDKCLTYNKTSNSFSVENANFKYKSDTIILFYNSHGSINGPWYRYYLQQEITQAIQAANVNKYPDYYNTQILQKTKQVNLQLAATTDVDGFIFINDVHYNKNEMHSPLLVDDVCRRTGITTVHLNGDQITREDSREAALMQINRINNMYVYSGVETYFTVGNHEWNNPSASNAEEALAIQVDLKQMRFAFVNPMRKRVEAFADNSISYFYDNPVSKIRYLVGCVTRGSTVITNSVKWIASKIEEAPSGYGIVIIIHTLLGFTKNGSTITPFIQNSDSADALVNIADAVRSGNSYTFGGVTYNYQNKNLSMIAIFCGDTHADLFMRTTGGVPIICTTTDSTDEDGNLTRTIGTVNEQAFDIVVIDRTHEKIYCNRIGAGVDREIDFAPTP